MDDGRRCALPGCDERISITDGRPDRRYCTAAHRGAARRARRAAGDPARGDDPLAPTLPWLRDSAPEPPARRSEPERKPTPTAAGDTAAPARSSHHRGEPVGPLGRRALVLLGVAGLLVGGYALSDAAPANAGRDAVGVVRSGDGPPQSGVLGGEEPDTPPRQDLDTAGEPDAAAPNLPAAPGTTGEPSDADRDTMAELRERVMQVAREARRAQAAVG